MKYLDLKIHYFCIKNKDTTDMTSAKYEEYISKYKLRRFVDAHRQIYGSALTEIRSGKKQSH